MSTHFRKSIVAFTMLLSFLVSIGYADDAFDKLFNAGKYAEALKYSDDNLPIANRDAATWVKIGIANEQQDMAEKALACFMVALRTDAKNYEACLGAARVNNKMGEYSNGADMAKKALDIKATGEASWEFARACIAQGKAADAKAALEKVVETDKSNAVANKELGNIYFKEKNFDKALPLLKAAQAANPDADIAMKLGMAYKDAGDVDNAIEYLKQASHDKKSPKPEAALALARLYFQKEKYNLCAEEYDYTNKTQLTGEDLFHFGIGLQKLDSTSEKAIGFFEDAVKKFGGINSKISLLASEKVARYKLQKKMYKDALALLIDINKADPQAKTVPDIYFMMSEAYDGSGERVKAIPMLEKVIATDKNNFEAYARLADLYNKEKMADKANELYSKLISVQPNNPKIYLSLGDYNLKTRKFSEALKNYQKSFQLEPGAVAAVGMMKSAWELKQYDLAGDAAETALSKDETLTEPMGILVKINMQNKNYAAAQQILEKMVKKDDDNVDLWNQLAQCYAGTNKTDNLADADKKIIGLDKKNTVSRNRFASYLMSKGDYKSALPIFTDLAALTPDDPAVFKNLNDLYLKLNDNDAALASLKKYVALKPNDAAAQKDLGNKLYDKKDGAGALNAYRATLKADPSSKGFFQKYADLVMAQKGQEQEVVTVLSAAVKAGEADEEIYSTLGNIYQKQGNFAGAIDMLQKSLQAKPQNFDALFSLAFCQEKAGRIAEAIISYEQASALNPSNEKVQKALGDLYIQQGKKAPAEAAYKKYLEKVPTDSRVAKIVGDYEFDQKNYKDAVKYLGMVNGEEAGRADFISKYGTAAYQTGDYKKAEALTKTLAAASPKDPEPFKTLYDISLKQNDNAAAAEYLRKYTVLKPTDADMLEKLGDLLYDQKNGEGALAAYKAVLKINPSAKGFYKKYVELIGTYGKPVEIAAALNGAVTAGEADAKMYAQLGEMDKKAGEYPKAIQNLGKATQLDPKNVDLMISLAECQARGGQVENAILTYEQEIAMNPSANKEYKALGDLYMKQKKTDAAIKDYKKYLEKSSDNEIAKLIGESETKEKDYAEAIKYFGKVSGDEAKAAPFLLEYGQACFEAKNDSLALSIYKQLSVLLPQDAGVSDKLYELTQRSGSKEDALVYLKKYTALKPSDASAQKQLGDALYDKKDSAGAMNAYRAVLKADPSAKGFFKKFAGLVTANGKDEEIVQVLTAAIAAGEADEGMYVRLGEIYRKQGDFKKAVQMYDKASQLDPKDAGLLSNLAECQAKSGNNEAAVLAYEQAIAMNPAAGKEYKLLGDLYMQQKKPDQAVKNYKKYLEKNTDNGIAKLVGETAYNQKNYVDAIKYLGMVSGADANSAAFVKMFAQACYEGKDNAHSYQLYKQLSLLTPSDADVFKRLYELAGSAGTKDESLLYLKKYAALKPADADVQKNLGDALYALKDNAGALAAYRAAFKANPNIKGIFKAFSELVVAGGQDNEIITVLNSAIAANEADLSTYMKLGEIYSKLNNFPKAGQMYDKASQLNPKDGALLTKLADCQVKNGKTEDAILTYEQAIAMNPAASKEYKQLGDLYMQQKKVDPAIKAYKNYLEKNTDNGIAKLVGQTAFNQKNYLDAIKYLGMVSGAEASGAEFVKMFAQACFEGKDDAHAYKLYKQLSILTPGDADVFKKLYELASKVGTKDETLLYMKKYVSLKPGDVEVQKSLGDALYGLKDKTGALSAYRAAFKADPNVKGIFKEFAELVISEGKDEEIILVLNSAITANEADLSMYTKLGEIYTKQNNFIKASQMFDKASQLNPKDGGLLTRLAECQMKSGKNEAAILTYEQAIAMNPAASKEYKLLGDLYMQQKKVDPAVKAYKKYLEKNSDNTIAKLVGETAYNQKNYPDAIKYLGMVSGADAGTAAFVKMFAQACYEGKDDFHAYQLYKQLSVLTPTDADVFKRLYDLAGRAGTKEETLVYMKKYTALKPGDVEVQKTLGDALYGLKDNAGALTAYRAALKADPNVKGIYKKFAELVVAAGKDEEIILVLNGAVAAGEADLGMYTKLGEVYSRQNNFVKAAQMFDKASQLSPRDGTLLTKLAECQVKNGKVEDAILTYEQAIAMNPAASKEYKLLGDLYMQQKKADPAVKNYRKYLEKNSDNAVARLVGETAFNQKNYPDAIKYLGMVNGADAGTAAFVSMYAQACYEGKDDFKAYSLYKQLSVLTPADAEVFKRLYTLAGKAGTKDESLMYMKKYTALRPNDVDVQKTLGDALYALKDNSGALAAYRAASKADPNVKGIYKKYAELVTAGGKDEEIVAVLNAAISAGEADLDMYVKLGEIYAKQNNFVKAGQMYDKASQLSPKDGTLLTRLAECQVKTGKIEDAILTYEQAIAMNPAAGKEYKLLGDLYMQQQKVDPAVKNYKKYLEKNSDNQIAKQVGDYAFKQKNYSEAITYFAKVTGVEANTAQFLMTFGQAAYLGRDDFRAYQIFKQLATLTPQDPAVYEKLKDIATRAGTKDEVLLYLKKYAALKPSDAQAQKTLGDMLYENKEMDGALAAYRGALKADSSLTGFYKKYAELVLANGTDEEKVAALKGAIASNEADAKMYQTLGDLYSKHGQAGKAIPLYQKASQMDSKNLPNILSALADCQVKTGAISDAISTYEQVTALNPMAQNEFKALGDLYLQQKKTDAAVRAYKRYLEKNPNSSEIALFIGKQSLETKSYSDAVRYLGMVTGAQTKTASFLELFGNAAYMAQDFPRALRIYNDLAELNPKDPSILKRIYDVDLKTGNSDAALSALRKYAALSPKDADAQRDLGDLLYKNKERAAALAAYSAALKADPSIKGFYKNYVDLVLDMGKPEEKVGALNGAINAGEADAKVYMTLGGIYKNSQNYPRAIQMFEKASQMDTRNADLLFSLAECLMKTGRLSEASITYEQAIALKPDAVKELKLLGDLYMQQKKTDAAMNAYKKYMDKYPSDAATAKAVAQYCFEGKNYKDAFKYYSMIKGDESPEYIVQYGLSAIEVREYSTAISDLERLRTMKGVVPQRDVAYKALADAYDKSGDPRKAAEVLNDYCKLPGVKDPDASYKRAVVYEGINPTLAVQMYEENTVAYPKDYRNFLKLGIFYSRQSNGVTKAVKNFERCNALSDTISRVWLELGSLYGKLKRDQDMLNAYRKYIEINPNDADACTKIGEVLLGKRMTDDAMVFLEMANSLKENDPKIMTLLARGYIMTKRRTDGARLLERVIKMTKGNVDDDMRLVLADVYMESGQYKEASDEYKTLLMRKPDNGLQLKLARAYLEQGKYNDAVATVQNIKSTDQESIEAHMMIGKIQVAQKKYDEAIETYKEILYVDQNYAPALSERANVYVIQGKWQWAKTFFDRALRADPNYAPAHLGMALCAKQDKDFATYSDQLEQAHKLDPNNKDIQDEMKAMRR